MVDIIRCVRTRLLYRKFELILTKFIYFFTVIAKLGDKEHHSAELSYGAKLKAEINVSIIREDEESLGRRWGKS